MAKNQAEIDIAKDINKNSKKPQTNKKNNQPKPRKTPNIKYCWHQESEEMGLSHGEGRTEINTATLLPK